MPRSLMVFATIQLLVDTPDPLEADEIISSILCGDRDDIVDWDYAKNRLGLPNKKLVVVNSSDIGSVAIKEAAEAENPGISTHVCDLCLQDA